MGWAHTRRRRGSGPTRRRFGNPGQIRAPRGLDRGTETICRGDPIPGPGAPLAEGSGFAPGDEGARPGRGDEGIAVAGGMARGRAIDATCRGGSGRRKGPQHAVIQMKIKMALFVRPDPCGYTPGAGITGFAPGNPGQAAGGRGDADATARNPPDRRAGRAKSGAPAVLGLVLGPRCNQIVTLAQVKASRRCSSAPISMTLQSNCARTERTAALVQHPKGRPR